MKVKDIINQTLYYGDSLLLVKLQYYPLALLLIIFLFGGLLYFFFQTNKASEQNRLWAGMAKETAHQIGTPLTSMIGWITLLKEKQPDSTSLKEIEKDIDNMRLISSMNDYSTLDICYKPKTCPCKELCFPNLENDNIYNYDDYSSKPIEYCGMILSSSVVN